MSSRNFASDLVRPTNAAQTTPVGLHRLVATVGKPGPLKILQDKKINLFHSAAAENAKKTKKEVTRCLEGGGVDTFVEVHKDALFQDEERKLRKIIKAGFAKVKVKGKAKGKAKAKSKSKGKAAEDDGESKVESKAPIEEEEEKKVELPDTEDYTEERKGAEEEVVEESSSKKKKKKKEKKDKKKKKHKKDREGKEEEGEEGSSKKEKKKKKKKKQIQEDEEEGAHAVTELSQEYEPPPPPSSSSLPPAPTPEKVSEVLTKGEEVAYQEAKRLRLIGREPDLLPGTRRFATSYIKSIDFLNTPLGALHWGFFSMTCPQEHPLSLRHLHSSSSSTSLLTFSSVIGSNVTLPKKYWNDPANEIDKRPKMKPTGNLIGFMLYYYFASDLEKMEIERDLVPQITKLSRSLSTEAEQHKCLDLGDMLLLKKRPYDYTQLPDWSLPDDELQGNFLTTLLKKASSSSSSSSSINNTSTTPAKKEKKQPQPKKAQASFLSPEPSPPLPVPTSFPIPKAKPALLPPTPPPPPPNTPSTTSLASSLEGLSDLDFI